jgi:hypothetical protein
MNLGAGKDELAKFGDLAEKIALTALELLDQESTDEERNFK